MPGLRLNGLGRPLGIETQTIVSQQNARQRHRLNGLRRPLGIETHNNNHAFAYSHILG